jgi:hypothetical protein
MFPDLGQIRVRVGALTGTLPVRISVAALLVLLHLGLVTRATHSRLHLPFSTVSEAPYFSDPDAAALSTPRQPHGWSRMAVSRLDAQHYIATAERGLTACPHDPSVPDSAYLDCGLGWMPAWGTVGGMVPMASDHALLVLAILAAFALNLLWTSPTIAKRLGRGGAYASLIGFNLFPAAFYLVTPYPEGATLALALAAFIALANERFILAAALVGASTALQPTGMAFALALAAALGVVAYTRKDVRLRVLLAIPLAFWGQLVTLLVLQIAVGDWSAYLRARHAFGAHYEFGRLFDIAHYMKGLAGQDEDGAMLLAIVAIIAFTTRDLIKRLSITEQTYLVTATVLAIALSIITPPNYWGQTRLLMSALLAFFGLGVIAKRSPLLFIGWCALCLAIYWHVDLCDYISQGDHAVCPSLGRIEVSVPL